MQTSAMLSLTVVVSLALAPMGCAAAGEKLASSPLTRCITAEAEALDFSGVVSVARPEGTTLYAHGLLGGPGSAEIGANTRFNLGSASKMFTAVAVAQLMDAGKVGLDDRIDRYVDGLTPEAAAVTVQQLLTHSSGLGNFFSPENLPDIKRARSVAELLPLARSDKPAFPPGSRVQYSNTGFLLLGGLIERASGLSYGDYLRLHVFTPAHMAASGLEPGPRSVQALGFTHMLVLKGAPSAGGAGPVGLQLGEGSVRAAHCGLPTKRRYGATRPVVVTARRPTCRGSSPL